MDHVSHTAKQKAQRWCKGWNLGSLMVVAGGQIAARDVENVPANLHCIAQGKGWPRVSTALRVLPLCTYRNKSQIGTQMDMLNQSLWQERSHHNRACLCLPDPTSHSAEPDWADRSAGSACCQHRSGSRPDAAPGRVACRPCRGQG